jgi:molecular chaperone GrpE
MGKKTDEGNKRNIEINVEPAEETVGTTDEQDIEETAPVEETASQEKSVEQRIDEYKEEIKKLEDRHLRLAAEFDNYKKRSARQFEDLIRSSGEKIIISLLDVIDNFERALEAASTSTDFKALYQGMELTYQQLYDVLKKEGVEPIKAVGEIFDPNLHEAMMQIESDEYPEGVIAQEISRGYKLNGRVIRFSKVAVSAPPPGDGKADEKE